MPGIGERKKGILRPDFNRRIKVDFQGATLSSNTGFLLLREIDERFGIIEEIAEDLLDSRSPAHTKQSIVQMIRQRVYQMAAGYEDCNDADFLRVDPALRLSLDKETDLGASQPMLSRLEAFPVVPVPWRYRYCGTRGLRLLRELTSSLLYSSTEKRSYENIIRDNLRRPAGRWPKSGVKVKIFDFPYRAGSWSKDRRVVCKIVWHQGELFPRVGFIVTNSRLSSKEVVQTYNGRVNVENRIKEGKNTLRWDKTSCHKFDANQGRLKMGLLAYNLLHL